MTFISIQQKQDSAEKLAAVQGKPRANYLFAPEFNLVVAAINSLRHLINLNAGNIDYLLSNANKIELGEIDVDFVTYINESEETTLAAPVFVTFTIDGIFYVKAYTGIDGTFGTIGGSLVVEEDFLPIYQSDEPDTEIPSSLLALIILGSDPSAPAADRVNFYALANTIAAQFADGQTIKFLKNATQNGILQMPYHSGLVEIQRLMKSIAGPSPYTILPDDASRTLLAVGANNLDIVIPFPPTSGGNHIIEIVNNSTATIRLTTTTYKVNGSLDPIILETNTLYRLKRVGTLDYILTPKPGGGTVPSATDEIAGIMKMYAAYGLGVDGAIRQDFFTSEMAKKAVIGDQRTVVPVAGEYVNIILAHTNGVVVSSNTLYYVGLTFLKDCFVDSVQILSGSTSGNGDLKFGVFHSDSNQKPGNKNAECTISVSGTNTVQTGVFATPISISKGLHWFTFARGTNGDLVTTYGINTPTAGNALENRGGIGDNTFRNASYAVANSPNTSLPSTVSTTVNAGIVMPKFALLISSVS